MIKQTNSKIYRVVGYAMVKEEEGEWHKLQDDLNIACPNGINPYNFICSQLKEVFTYWLITLYEIKNI